MNNGLAVAYQVAHTFGLSSEFTRCQSNKCWYNNTMLLYDTNGSQITSALITSNYHAAIVACDKSHTNLLEKLMPILVSYENAHATQYNTAYLMRDRRCIEIWRFNGLNYVCMLRIIVSKKLRHQFKCISLNVIYAMVIRP